MPIYEYECSKCGEVFEVLVRSNADRHPSCPKCGNKKPKKLLSAFAVACSDGGGVGCDGCDAADSECDSGACSGGSCPYA